MNCIFCNIIKGTAPAEVLYESDRALAILDINPIHYGHALVFPKGHAETFLEVPEDELAEVMKALSVVSRAIVQALKPTGFNIFSNNGKAAGQSILHFHFHITPRYEDDNIKFILELKKYGPEELSRYARKLRDYIDKSTLQSA
jgi:histidine triad (HIT) family protein